MHSRGVLSLVLLAVCAVFLVVAGAWLFTALRPRLDNDKASRFAFPHLADADLDELADYDPEEVRREAWMQAQTLAKIGLGKYRRFNNALFCSLAAGLGFLGWLLVVPAT